MLTGVLPATLDLTRIGSEGADLKADLPADGMNRLRQAAIPPETVMARLRLRRDAAGRTLARVNVGATVTMTCQRCLESVTLPIDAESDLIVEPRAREQEGDPEGADILVAPGWRLDVAALVEDELLLALPLVPKHEQAEACVAQDRQFGPPGGLRPAERENPFAVLSQLRRGESKDDEQSGEQ